MFFVQLPTGFGKSIIYQIIPRVKAALVSGEGEREGRENMQVIVVSRLVQIMQGRVRDLISQIVNRL